MAAARNKNRKPSILVGQTDHEKLTRLAEAAADSPNGGRAVEQIIGGVVLPELSRRVLEIQVAGRPVRRIDLDAAGGELAYAVG